MTPAELIRQNDLNGECVEADQMAFAERVADELLLEAAGLLIRNHDSEGTKVIIDAAIRKMLDDNGPEFENTEKRIGEISGELEETEKVYSPTLTDLVQSQVQHTQEVALRLGIAIGRRMGGR